MRWIPCAFARELCDKPITDYRYNGIKRTTGVIADEDFQIRICTIIENLIYCTLLNYTVMAMSSTYEHTIYNHVIAYFNRSRNITNLVTYDALQQFPC